MHAMVVLHCAHCRDEREFEQPPCVDGHDLDCPELACVECGMAVVLPWSELVDEEIVVASQLRTAV